MARNWRMAVLASIASAPKLLRRAHCSRQIRII
jgi:hypothetical protein